MSADVPRRKSTSADAEAAGRLGEVDRGLGRVDPDDPESGGGEGAGEDAGAAPEVDDGAGGELLGDRPIGLEIVTVSVEGVVDGDELRVREDRIGHGPKLAQEPCLGRTRSHSLDVHDVTWQKVRAATRSRRDRG